MPRWNSHPVGFGHFFSSVCAVTVRLTSPRLFLFLSFSYFKLSLRLLDAGLLSAGKTL